MRAPVLAMTITVAAAAPSFYALSSVPGRAASQHFNATIRAAGSNDPWRPLAVLETMAKKPR